MAQRLSIRSIRDKRKIKQINFKKNLIYKLIFGIKNPDIDAINRMNLKKFEF